MMKHVAVLAGAVLVAVTGALPAQEVLFATTDRFVAGDSYGDDSRHRYTVRLEADTTIEVRVTSDDVDTYLEAVLPGGGRIVNDDYDGLNAGFLRHVATAGEMTILAQPLFDGGEGAYRLTVERVAPPAEIEIGSSVSGTFDKTDVGDGRRAHRYIVRGEAGQRITIDLESSDFDAYLEARDDGGREFADDDGGAEGYNSRLSYAFESDGSLQLTATSFGGDGMGDYELRVSESASELVVDYRGTLREDGPRAYDGTLVDSYEYEARGGDTVTLVLESQDFDPVLYVAGPTGRTLARDDDSGGGSDSMVTVTFPDDGTYTFHVTPFAEGTGDYLLSVYR